jgi:hypothetical protein
MRRKMKEWRRDTGEGGNKREGERRNMVTDLSSLLSVEIKNFVTVIHPYGVL